MSKWHRVTTGIWIAQPFLKRGDENWCVIIRRSDYRDGKQTSRRVGPSRKDALFCATKIKESLLTTGSNTSTVGGALLLFLQEHARTLRPRTEQLYAGRIRNHLIPKLGEVGLRELTSARIFDYALGRLSAASPPTVETEVGTLKTALNWYWDTYDIDSRCPARHVKGAFRKACDRAKVTAKVRRDEYTSDEVTILLHHAKAYSHPDAVDLFALGAATGLRKGEILGMEWKGIDWDRGTYDPVWQIDCYGEAGPLKAPREKPAVLSPAALEVLRKRMAKPASNRWVFASRNGTPFKGSNVQKWIKAIRVAAEENGVPISKTFHSLRHYFASHAAENGWSWPAIQNQLGHATADFTARRYTHPVENVERNWDWGLADSADKPLTVLTESKVVH